METIGRLVQGEETNFRDGAIVEKIPTLQSMAIQPIVPTRLPRPPTIGFEELSLLTRDEWDIERCELIHERDQLKEDLLKAQDVLADVAQWEEALQAEHKRLQEEYSQEKATWENKSRKSEEEAQQLHED
ncbi:hypothetical protein R1flu_016949 [Riccia fluitans]|uniref:Uncharacterized protein n=1 Tax=Riccia fluitans TaxID=41844 RepID=A0ABD1YNK1_9MARC